MANLGTFTRADTAKTMVSRVNSTSEIGRGLSFVYDDALANLPDNLEELEDSIFTCVFCYVLTNSLTKHLPIDP